MKALATYVASLTLALCGTGSAFTLGFDSIALGTTVSGATTLTVNVLGYGNVVFEAVGGSSLSIGEDYKDESPGATTHPSLNFDPSEKVKVTFMANNPTNITFRFVGVNTGEYFVPSAGANAKEYFIELNGLTFEPQNRGAGLYQIGFQQVPEPSAAGLGVIGAFLLLVRRRL